MIRIFIGGFFLELGTGGDSAIGGILMFSAIYDRCLIWKAITAQLKRLPVK